MPLSKEENLELRSHYLGESCSLFFRENPLKIEKSAYQYMFDERGNRYLDCINNVAHVGHCHSEIAKAVFEQMLQQNTNSRFLHDNIVELSAKLSQTLPKMLHKWFYTNSGSEANDLAMQLAMEYTRGSEFIVMEGGYHGHTLATLSISSYKQRIQSGVHVYSLPTAQSKDVDVYRNQIKQMIEERVTKKGKRLAGFICESALSCGGQYLLPRGFLQEVYSQVRKMGGICIADEVQTGFGRLGKVFWGFELQKVIPDIITMGKAMGNGYPISAVVTKSNISIALANSGLTYFNTFAGNPVACVTTLTMLKVLKQDKLQENAVEVGSHLLNRLTEVKEMFSNFIADVRGLGFFIGIEISCHPNNSSDAKTAKKIVEKMRDLFVILSIDGMNYNVIKIKPPMCFTKKNADEVVDKLVIVLTNINN